MSGWLQGFLLALAPLLILVGLLILGRYPGEDAIRKLRRVVDLLLRPSAPPSLLHTCGSGHIAPVRGGCLIASSLAGRAPPA